MRPWFALIPATSAALLALAARAQTQEVHVCRHVEVLAGDTLTCLTTFARSTGHWTVHLAGAWAPPLDTPEGVADRETLRQHVMNREVTCQLTLYDPMTRSFTGRCTAMTHTQGALDLGRAPR